MIYKRTKNVRAIQLLLGHTKLERTVRYIGIEVDDALEIATQSEIRAAVRSDTGGLHPRVPRNEVATVKPGSWYVQAPKLMGDG